MAGQKSSRNPFLIEVSFLRKSVLGLSSGRRGRNPFLIEVSFLHVLKGRDTSAGVDSRNPFLIEVSFLPEEWKKIFSQPRVAIPS